MSETNTLHHHFRLDYLFDIKTAKSIDRNKIIFDDEGEYDFIGRSSDNYGIQGKVRHLGYEPNAANTFSIVQVGESRCLFRDNPWYASQNIFILKPRFPELVDVQLYITCVLNKPLEIYKEAYKYPTLSVLKGIKIQLPVLCNGSPDWNYMQERIAELEQERIAELEQYLVAAGLNDYELDDEDHKVLSRPLCEESGCAKIRDSRAFYMRNLFEKADLKWIANRKFNKKGDLSTQPTEEFNLPLCNAKFGNNGIMYYGRDTDFSFVDGGIDIINDGAVSTGSVYPQPHRIGVLYNAYVLVLKNGPKEQKPLEYLSCVIEKSIKHKFGYNNKATWNKVKIMDIHLPIQTNEEGTPIIDPERKYHAEGYIPDWDYMTAYIRAMKKVVIADVVKYKDEVIAKTRSLIPTQ